MSDHSAFGFGKFVPGFDFLQGLAKTASQTSTAAGAIPGMSNWVAPTLSVEELDKRIQELKAVQFWLEQNGTALKATIQALEVQKMTLSTLQGMNVNMAELAKAFTAQAPQPQATAPEPTTAPSPEPATEAQPPSAPKAKRSPSSKTPKSSGSATVDPMQWWGALTQQFQNIASAAMQDAAAQAMKGRPAETETRKEAATSAKGPSAAKKPARKKSPAAKTRPSRA